MTAAGLSGGLGRGERSLREISREACQNNQDECRNLESTVNY